MYTFVTGGYRSGRSNYALRRASELGHPPWLYVSAGVEPEDAVKKRIERHRRDVEAIWRTAVIPARIGDALSAQMLEGFGAAVFDGIPSWIAERLAGAGPGPDADRALLDEIEVFAERLYHSSVPVVVVSTEMGLGVPPRDPAEQRLLKIAASANQILAQGAGAVVLMVSGVPVRVS